MSLVYVKVDKHEESSCPCEHHPLECGTGAGDAEGDNVGETQESIDAGQLDCLPNFDNEGDTFKTAAQIQCP